MSSNIVRLAVVYAGSANWRAKVAGKDDKNEKPRKTRKPRTASQDKVPGLEAPSLADELGVKDLKRTYFRAHGREFAAAGRKTPVAEIADDGLVMYSPDKPFSETPRQLEDIRIYADSNGIVLNELGERRKILGAKFRGHDLYWLAETAPGTTRHLVAWFDDEWRPHKLYMKGTALTTDLVFKLRNRTHNGEIAGFPEVSADA